MYVGTDKEKDAKDGKEKLLDGKQEKDGRFLLVLVCWEVCV